MVALNDLEEARKGQYRICCASATGATFRGLPMAGQALITTGKSASGPEVVQQAARRLGKGTRSQELRAPPPLAILPLAAGPEGTARPWLALGRLSRQRGVNAAITEAVFTPSLSRS